MEWRRRENCGTQGRKEEARRRMKEDERGIKRNKRGIKVRRTDGDKENGGKEMR